MAKIDKTKLPKVLTDKYIVGNETFKREVKSNPKDRIEVEIGDALQPDFKPQFKFMRWNDEVNFSLRAEEKVGATVETQGEKIKYITPDYEVHLYDKPEVAEDGGFEFEVILKEKPLTNRLEFTIQTKELDFFKDIGLDEENDSRYHTVTPTEAYDKDGKLIAWKEEKTVGSLIAYHKTKG